MTGRATIEYEGYTVTGLVDEVEIKEKEKQPWWYSPGKEMLVPDLIESDLDYYWVKFVPDPNNNNTHVTWQTKERGENMGVETERIESFTIYRKSGEDLTWNELRKLAENNNVPTTATIVMGDILLDDGTYSEEYVTFEWRK